jgi:ribonuclease P protein component
VLPPRHRLRRSEDFRRTMRRGRAGRGALVVVHVRTARDTHPPVVGFAVGRGVGDAVTRNRVRRRLRHLTHQRLARLPLGSSTVVRALPAAAAADWQNLGDDLDEALQRALAGRR